MLAKTSISKAISLLGGPVAAARRLGIKRYQTVQQWEISCSIPPKYCPQIERELDGAVTCEELCPSVDWKYLRGTAKSMATEANVGALS